MPIGLSEDPIVAPGHSLFRPMKCFCRCRCPRCRRHRCHRPRRPLPLSPPLSAVATAAFPRPLPLSPPPRPPPPMSSLGLCHCPPSTGPAVFPRPMRLSPSAAAGGPRYAPTRNHVGHVTPPIKKTVNPPPPPHPPPSSSFLFQTQNGG